MSAASSEVLARTVDPGAVISGELEGGRLRKGLRKLGHLRDLRLIEGGQRGSDDGDGFGSGHVISFSRFACGATFEAIALKALCC